jgi:hypothetical protein
MPSFGLAEELALIIAQSVEFQGYRAVGEAALLALACGGAGDRNRLICLRYPGIADCKMRIVQPRHAGNRAISELVKKKI